VAYHGRTTRKVTIKEIAIYIMAPYGFDAFGPDVRYLGHFNKKHFALVTDGEWVNVPVYAGADAHAKNALMRPVAIPHYTAWRQKHNKGGDMLLFSERLPSYPDLEMVVKLRNTVTPQVAGQEVIRALQHSQYADDYKGQYQFVLQDFGEYATAGTSVLDRVDGTIRLNSNLFFDVSAENISMFAAAVAHETLHQNQNPLFHYRDTLPLVGHNPWHEKLDDKALTDSASVLDEIKNALGF